MLGCNSVCYSKPIQVPVIGLFGMIFTCYSTSFSLL